MNLPEFLENQRLITALEIGLFILLILIAVKTWEIGSNVQTIKIALENGTCQQIGEQLVWK